VRGQLRKNAKKYDSQSEDDRDSDIETGFAAMQNKRTKKVVRKTMAAAFKSIMTKKIEGDQSSEGEEDAAEEDEIVPAAEVIKASTKSTAETILAKYKKKARDLDAAKAVEDAEKKKSNLKEKQRLMGRRIPTRDDAEKERSLAIIATRGVVSLFNAVAEFQTSVEKEHAKDDLLKKRTYHEKVQAVGQDKSTGAVGFNSHALI